MLRDKELKYNITGLKTPSGRRQPDGYLQAWPRIQLGTTENKSSKWPERDLTPGPPECELDALTTRPLCLLESKIRKNPFAARCIIS